jgi:hypothetical protein
MEISGNSLQSGSEGFLSNYLGKTKVSQLHAQLLVGQEDILWLDIAVDDITVMLKSTLVIQSNISLLWTLQDT